MAGNTLSLADGKVYCDALECAFLHSSGCYIESVPDDDTPAR